MRAGHTRQPRKPLDLLFVTGDLQSVMLLGSMEALEDRIYKEMIGGRVNILTPEGVTDPGYILRFTAVTQADFLQQLQL